MKEKYYLVHYGGKHCQVDSLNYRQSLGSRIDTINNQTFSKNILAI